MKMDLPYGQEVASLEIPEAWLADARVDILTPQYPLSEWTPDSLVRILENPIASPSLSKFLTGATSLLVVVSDRTRPAGYHRWLAPLIEYAIEIRPTIKIGFLVATGTHAPESAYPLQDVLPETLAERFQVWVHSADEGGYNPVRFVPLGVTSRGTPVSVNGLLLQHDRILATGSVNFHYYAGFTGGRKALIPGCASRETIEKNHALVLSPVARRGRHPQARSAVLATNPVSEDLSEATSFIPTPIFLVNSILRPDGRVVGLIAGDLFQAHRYAANLLTAWGSIRVSARYDLVIASAGGHPFDISYYQAHKAFDELHRITENGGRVILFARLPLGIGDPVLCDALKTSSAEVLESILRTRYDHAIQIAFSHRLKMSTTELCLVSDLSEDSGRLLGVPVFRDARDAIANLDGARPRSIAVVPSAAGVHFTGVASRL